MNNLRFILALAASALFVSSAIAADEPASIAAKGSVWTLRNETLQTTISFADGKLRMDSFRNRAANADYLQGQARPPLFTHQLDGATVAADDGGWTLDSAEIKDIALYGRSWGKRLEITLSRKAAGTGPVPSAKAAGTGPVPSVPKPQPQVPSQVPDASDGRHTECACYFSTRQVFEIYNGRAALRYSSFVKNGTDKELTIRASDVFDLDLPDRPHALSYVERVFTWRQTRGGLSRGGRNGIVRYDAGDGWFCAPENNWATSLTEGQGNADPNEKLLALDIFQGGGLRVAVNPKALQLTLFPHEEIEWFAVNLGVFSGDLLDGRMAAAEHFRQRFKFHDPSHILSVNDWQWGVGQGRRTDKNYRQIVIPKAAAAGFDRINIDAEWYTEDGTAPLRNWTDMPSLCEAILAQGMQPGHWFPLQGRGGSCVACWYNGHGRDAADPANIAFKLKQTEETLIGKYHSAWGQLDCGLLWRTDRPTAYSHPGDSVYRKLLGMRRYIDAVTHNYPDYLLHVTCEIDNPGGARCAQNVGLAHLGDNAIIGTFNRVETGDDVRDLFASFGLFPLEGELSTPGEGGTSQTSWADSPLWYYQFLLARHTSIYSWPGNWSEESVAHLRAFNDWRKNPRIKAVLNEPLRPVYNGPDWLKNEGPWAWMFTDQRRTKALLIAINHLHLAKQNSFAAKLRWLDENKTYLIEEITQTPDGDCAYSYRGQFRGAQLKSEGLPIDLDAGDERCAAFWIQERTSSDTQVLYADAAVTSYVSQPFQADRQSQARVPGTPGRPDLRLTVELQGQPRATARLIVYKPGRNGAENRIVALDAQGRGTATFDAATISQPVQPAAAWGKRDDTTAGAWHGKYGATAAWLAGQKIEPAHGFTLKTSAPVYVWGQDDATPRVLALPPGQTGAKVAACWTTADQFTMRVAAPADRPYRLTVYVMDYDNGKRGMEIGVRSRDGTLHDRQTATVAETNQGVYFTWDVTGPATIKARKTEGCNAAVSGVFVDAATNHNKERKP